MTDVLCPPSRPSLVRCIVPASALPVSGEKAKLWARVDSDAEIDTIIDLVGSATAVLDGWNGRLNPKRALCLQTWEAVFDGFPTEVTLPLVPVVSIESIAYLDGDGAEQDVAPSDDLYRLASDDWHATLILNDGAAWPSTLAGPATVTIRFVAGYEIVPAALAQDVLTLVGYWFDNRDKIGQFPAGWVSAYKRPVYA
jgi:uncharacterized phiE125 gp8 family phage protein